MRCGRELSRVPEEGHLFAVDWRKRVTAGLGSCYPGPKIGTWGTRGMRVGNAPETGGDSERSATIIGNMRFDIVTIFPGFFEGVFAHGIVSRALKNGLVTVEAHDLREHAHDRHRTVDDRPFGGGEGMVLKPEPLAEALEALGVRAKAEREDRERGSEGAREQGPCSLTERRRTILVSWSPLFPRSLSLCRAAASCGCITEGAEKERTVQRVKMLQQRRNLGQERIVEDLRNFFVAATACIADQLAHFHAKGEGEPLERTQGRDRLAVFDFRNVGARHLHPSRELTLAQMAGAAQFPHLRRYLHAGVVAMGRRVAHHQMRSQLRRFLVVEGFVAFSAKGIAGSILHQSAAFTPHHFTRIHADHRSSHRLCGGARASDPAVRVALRLVLLSRK